MTDPTFDPDDFHNITVCPYALWMAAPDLFLDAPDDGPDCDCGGPALVQAAGEARTALAEATRLLAAEHGGECSVLGEPFDMDLGGHLIYPTCDVCAFLAAQEVTDDH